MDPIIDFVDVGFPADKAVAFEVKKTVVELDLNAWVSNQPDEATRQDELLDKVAEEVAEEVATLKCTSTQTEQGEAAEVETLEVQPDVVIHTDGEVVVTASVTADELPEADGVSEVVVSQVTPTVVIQQEESEVVEGVTEQVSLSASEDSVLCTPKKETRVKWKEIEAVSPPPIDIIELKDSYHIYAEVPGLSVKDISIDLSNNMFTLTGDKRDHPLLSSTPVKPENGDVVVRREINQKGRFKRVLELPDNVDPSDVNVQYEEGMLQFKIRKIVEMETDEAQQEKKQEEQEKQAGVANNVEKESKEGESTQESSSESKQEVEGASRKTRNSKSKKRASCLMQ